MTKRTAVFISHATPEGNDFTLWLGTKLSAIGYEVWADVLRLHGGDDWARKLEDGLRNRSIKVLLVADDHSVSKQGVRNEIQIASDVARKIEDNEFIIPLQLSDFEPPFLIAHTQFVNFKKSWSDGLVELLEILQEHGVPKYNTTSESIGLDSWRHAHLHKSRSIEKQPETLISNWLPVSSLPKYIRVFEFRAGIVIRDKDQALRNSTIPLVPHKRGFIGFAPQSAYEALFGVNLPLKPLAEIELAQFLNYGSSGQEIEKFDAKRKVVDLMRQALETSLANSGLSSMKMSNSQLAWWWQRTVDTEKQISFSWENGPSGRRKIVGFLEKSSKYWHYGLSFSPFLTPTPHIKLTSRVIFSENGIDPLSNTEYMFRLRRSKTKSWRNPRWRDMMLAFLSYLAQGENKLMVSFGGDTEMLITLPPISFEAPITVNEGNILEEEILEIEEFDNDDWHNESDEADPDDNSL